jgi:hypothetical protein
MTEELIRLEQLYAAAPPLEVAAAPDELIVWSGHVLGEITRTRSGWVRVFIYEDTTQASRYFSQYLRLAGSFADQLQLYETAHGAGEAIQAALAAIADSIDHLLNLYPGMVDPARAVPRHYLLRWQQRLEPDLERVIPELHKKVGNGPLTRLVTAVVNDCFAGTGRRDITFHDLSYTASLLKVLKASLLSGDLHTEDDLEKQLTKLNFNHIGFFALLQQGLCSLAEGLPEADRLSFYQQQYDQYYALAAGSSAAYDPAWPAIAFMIKCWVSERLLQAGQQNRETARSLRPSLTKIKLDLPVAHLACLLRLLNEANLFPGVSLAALFLATSHGLESKRKQAFSSRNISKEYYSVTQGTAAKVLDLLQLLSRQLKRQYFP